MENTRAAKKPLQHEKNGTPDTAPTSSHFERMDTAQQSWLHSLGLHKNPSITDCDVTAQTITFECDDGSRVTRTRCEVYTRVMGYHRPVSNFNPGKQAEFAERLHFTESACTM